MKRLWYFVILIVISSSCNRERKADTFTIHGQFSNFKSEKIVLCELDVKQVIPLDSAMMGNDGKVTFTHSIDQPGFYLLVFPDSRITLVIKKGEEITVSGDLKDPDETIRITGSEDSELLESFFRTTLKNKIRIDSIKSLLRQHEGMDDLLRVSMMADSLFAGISSDQEKIEKEFIDRHPQSLASLIVLNYSFGPKPVLTMEENLPYYLKLTGLWRLYPKNKHFLFHMARVSLYLNNLKNPPA